MEGKIPSTTRESVPSKEKEEPQKINVIKTGKKGAAIKLKILI